MDMAKRKPLLRLQTTIILLVCIVVATTLLVTTILVSAKVSENTQKNEEEKAANISRMIAHSPQVIAGLDGQGDPHQIQTFAEEIRRVTGVEFIVVMDMNGIRKSHPDRQKIGKRFVGGDEKEVLKGHEHISIAKGTLGVSLRSFTPVFTPAGKQVGAVAVGIPLNSVKQAVWQSRLFIFLSSGLGGFVGILGAYLLARKIKKIMFGLEPNVIATLLEERSAMLESTREGIIAIDADARITLINSEGIRLLNQAGIIGENIIGRPLQDLMSHSSLQSVLEKGIPELDEERDINGIRILTNSIPIKVNEKIVGAIATFRDKTEIEQLAEELTGVRLYADALRAQTHEFMNKLHVILGMVQLGLYDRLSDYIERIANQQQTESESITSQIKHPVLAGFIIGKISHAREEGVDLVLATDSYFPDLQNEEMIHDLITILGNLIANAVEALAECFDKRIFVHIRYQELEELLVLQVRDTGLGFREEKTREIFTKGYSTKGENRGIGLYLIQRTVEKWNGKIELLSKPGKGTTFKVILPFKIKGENV
jgi:two-component system, CitB family, sensor histidine kinase MalK